MAPLTSAGVFYSKTVSGRVDSEKTRREITVHLRFAQRIAEDSRQQPNPTPCSGRLVSFILNQLCAARVILIGRQIRHASAGFALVGWVYVKCPVSSQRNSAILIE